jgi:hypothetical protein
VGLQWDKRPASRVIKTQTLAYASLPGSQGEVGRGGRPKQHANVHPAHADLDKIDGGEQAQRDKRHERLPVFALERARPASTLL